MHIDEVYLSEAWKSPQEKTTQGLIKLLPTSRAMGPIWRSALKLSELIQEPWSMTSLSTSLDARPVRAKAGAVWHQWLVYSPCKESSLQFLMTGGEHMFLMIYRVLGFPGNAGLFHAFSINSITLSILYYVWQCLGSLRCHKVFRCYRNSFRERQTLHAIVRSRWL